MVDHLLLRPDRSAVSGPVFSVVAQGGVQAFIPLSEVTASFQRPGEAAITGPVIAGPHRFAATCQIRANGPVAVVSLSPQTLSRFDLHLPHIAQKLVSISDSHVAEVLAPRVLSAENDGAFKRELSLRQKQRIARAQTGLTTAATRQLRRLQTARDDVLHSAKTLVEIALEHGFYDQAHFTSTYRLWSGVTPKLDRDRGSSNVVFLQDQSGWSPLPERMIEFGDYNG
ncbi:helix-turn-helix domain-containing protein [Aquidulcibacter sp.]|uniref:helix-turn-helix domain-containing protein n=1 Tax=Aquidulcibacter sp. TaxID=2052990 RepID=UPI0025BBEE61|nr:helix-turn-helix domain-containing protein [Aquidulcibacter sp.]MCA3692961.1 helix-turn-helix domain-containing protein [Aquidulcibacter sp.]